LFVIPARVAFGIIPLDSAKVTASTSHEVSYDLHVAFAIDVIFQILFWVDFLMSQSCPSICRKRSTEENIPVDSLQDFTNSKKGMFKRRDTLKRLSEGIDDTNQDSEEQTSAAESTSPDLHGAKPKYKISSLCDVFTCVPISIVHYRLVVSTTGASDDLTALSVFASLRLVYLLRVRKLPKYLKCVEEVFQAQLSDVPTAPLRILYQFVLLLIVSHWLACGWSFFDSATNTAYIDPSLTDSNWKLYSTSLYFVFVTTATVGYGDIKPRSTNETLYSIMLMIVGTFAYAAVTANIASLAANIDVTSETFSNKLDSLANFMRKWNVDSELELRVQAYFRDLWLQYKGVSPIHTLAQFSPALRQDVLSFLVHKNLKQAITTSQVLKDSDAAFLSHMVSFLEHILVSTGDCILRKDDVCTSLFFLNQGTVSSVVELGQIGVRVPAPNFINEKEAIGKVPQPNYISAVSLCELWALHPEHNEFLQQLYPHFKEAVESSRALASHALRGVRKRSVFKPITRKGSIIGIGLETYHNDTDQDSSDSSIFRHNSPCRQKWDLAALVLLVLTLLILPPVITFTFDDNLAALETVLTVIFACTDVFFLVDLYMRAFRFSKPAVAKYDDFLGGLVPIEEASTSREIFRQYVCGGKRAVAAMILDVMAVIPFARLYLLQRAAVSEKSVINIQFLLNANRVLLVYRMGSYLRNFDAFLDNRATRFSFQTRRVIKLVILAVILMHWMSCGWHALGYQFKGSCSLAALCGPVACAAGGGVWTGSSSWFFSLQCPQSSVLAQYLRSFYWALQTVSTTGYGDILSQTHSEQIFTIVVIITGDVIYGAIIGSISIHVANMTDTVEAYQSSRRGMDRFLQNHELGGRLKNRVDRYFQYLEKMGANSLSGGDPHAPLRQIPERHRFEMAWGLYKTCLKEVPWLKGVDETFLGRMACLFKVRFFLAGDTIVKIGDIGRELYLLSQGRVMVFVYKRDGSLARKVTLDAPSQFGEAACFTSSLRTATIRAACNCHTLVLTKADFDTLLDNYPLMKPNLHAKFVQHAMEHYKDIAANVEEDSQLSKLSNDSRRNSLSETKDDATNDATSSAKPKNDQIEPTARVTFAITKSSPTQQPINTLSTNVPSLPLNVPNLPAVPLEVSLKTSVTPRLPCTPLPTATQNMSIQQPPEKKRRDSLTLPNAQRQVSPAETESVPDPTQLSNRERRRMSAVGSASAASEAMAAVARAGNADAPADLTQLSNRARRRMSAVGSGSAASAAMAAVVAAGNADAPAPPAPLSNRVRRRVSMVGGENVAAAATAVRRMSVADVVAAAEKFPSRRASVVGGRRGSLVNVNERSRRNSRRGSIVGMSRKASIASVNGISRRGSALLADVMAPDAGAMKAATVDIVQRHNARRMSAFIVDASAASEIAKQQIRKSRRASMTRRLSAERELEAAWAKSQEEKRKAAPTGAAPPGSKVCEIPVLGPNARQGSNISFHTLTRLMMLQKKELVEAAMDTKDVSKFQRATDNAPAMSEMVRTQLGLNLGDEEFD